MTAGGEPGPSPRAGRLLAVVVFLAVWGLITHGTYAGSGDEPHYLVIAHSLAFDRDLDVANNYREATLIGGGTLQPESHARWRDGRLRPVHDVGMPAVFAPIVRVAYPLAGWLGRTLPDRVRSAARLNEALLLRHQISLAMALVAALLAREVFLLLGASVTASTAGAFGSALLFALTPPVLSHAFLFFTEVPTALAATVVFRRLMALAEGRAPGLGAWTAGWMGVLAGGLVLLHARNVGLAAGLAVLAIVYLRRLAAPGTATVFAAAFTAAVVLRIWTTWTLWGTLVTTPHAAVGVPASAGGMLLEIFTRVTGLLFDREHGLLAYGPVYLLALPGLLLVSRLRTPLAFAVPVVTAGYLVPVLLPITNVHGWTGGWAPAARFLVPIAPLLWIGVSMYGTRAAGRMRVIVASLILVQLAIDGYVWQSPMSLWNDGDGVSAFRWTAWLPTWTAPGSTVAFAAALAAALVFTRQAVRRALHAPADPPPSPHPQP